MKIEPYSSPSVFDTLADDWDRLPDPSRSDVLYLSLLWQRTWWKHLGHGDLLVLAVRDDDGTLRGIAPWFIHEGEAGREVAFIGCVDLTDYLDVIASPGYESPVLEAVLSFMLSPEAPDWEVIDLCNVPQESPTLTLLPPLAEECGLPVEVTVQEVCPVITLTGSYDDYLAALDGKQRHELRRKRRRAEGQETGWYVVGPEHDLDAEIDAFFDLMARSMDEKAGFLQEAGHRDFFREMGHLAFDADFLRLYFLTIEGQRAAAMWQFEYRDRMMLYNSGHDPASFAALSPGIVLLTYSIEDAAVRGIRHYDFLRGDETYKYRMGAAETTVHNILIRRR